MKPQEVVFEESLSDEWSRDLGVIEVPINDRPLIAVAFCVALLGVLLGVRVLWLAAHRGSFYERRAEQNLAQEVRTPAPRGLITDRTGAALADNKPVFAALLHLREFLKHEELQGNTLDGIRETLAVSPEEVWTAIHARDVERSVDPIVLKSDLTQPEIVALRALDLETLSVIPSFTREYREGPVFASLLGYLGFPTAKELAEDESLTGDATVGKSGVELFFDSALRGAPGVQVRLRDAWGNVLGEQKRSDPAIGSSLTLTVDAEFQEYLYRRFMDGLTALGRTAGVGLALDPRNGEVFALVSFPTFDANVFQDPARSEERARVLQSPGRPLFNRAVAGLYPPGSTIKPLHAVAALEEGVIAPDREVFSPGYLDVPNPYDAEHPTRFLDWRFQGNVNVRSAIAQSSNVYFYLAGGGSPARTVQDPALVSQTGIRGLGVERLKMWWERFRLDQPTGIDVPGEATGFLPTPQWKEKKTGSPWRLGDTYNVSIGQGDLLTTPVALLNYIAAIANDGKLYQPVVRKTDAPPSLLADLSAYLPEIREVQAGMRQAVTSPVGTAHLMDALPVPVAGKTGSAQVRNNQEENAFFVGYMPAENPEIALLVLVENAREGSLNAVPIAKDLLEWYYVHRLQNTKSKVQNE